MLIALIAAISLIGGYVNNRGIEDPRGLMG